MSQHEEKASPSRAGTIRNEAAGPQHLVVADARRARLCRTEPTGTGRQRMVEIEILEEEWEEREHGRPIMTAADGRSFASHTHEDEERLRRFARAIREWLHSLEERLGDERVAVLAPPNLLGALRRDLPERMQRHFELHEGDFGPLAARELVTHPTIRSLLHLS